MTKSAKKTEKYDVTKEKIMCLHCYWSGEADFMYAAAAFGVSKTSEFLPNILMNGAWTRCERCQRKMPQTDTAAGDTALQYEIDILKKQAMEHATKKAGKQETVKCVVCEEEKIKDDYNDFIWYHRNKRGNNRCPACFNCPTCPPRTKHSLLDFKHGAKICNTCTKTLTCVVCKKDNLKSEYSDSVWKNQKSRRHIRCKTCLICPKCPAGTVHGLDDFTFGSTICKGCDTITCSACEKQIEQYLCKTIRYDAIVLCASCEDRGCTRRHLQLYTCDECSQQFGVQHYDQKQLDNKKQKQFNALVCKTCVTERTKRLTKLKVCVSHSKRICRCNTVRAPGHHVESCLTSEQKRSHRWPGSDTGVTLRDFRFLQRYKPNWWMKALGKALREGSRLEGSGRPRHPNRLARQS